MKSKSTRGESVAVALMTLGLMSFSLVAVWNLAQSHRHGLNQWRDIQTDIQRLHETSLPQSHHEWSVEISIDVNQRPSTGATPIPKTLAPGTPKTHRRTVAIDFRP